MLEDADRTIRACATSEGVLHNTIVTHEASKVAFQKQNVNAVLIDNPETCWHPIGKVVAVLPMDDKKKMFVDIMLSRGADDVVQWIKEKKLTGAGISMQNGVYEERVIDGQTVKFITRYELVDVLLTAVPIDGCEGIEFLAICPQRGRMVTHE